MALYKDHRLNWPSMQWNGERVADGVCEGVDPKGCSERPGVKGRQSMEKTSTHAEE